MPRRSGLPAKCRFVAVYYGIGHEAAGPCPSKPEPPAHTSIAPPDTRRILTVAPLIPNKRCYGEYPASLPGLSPTTILGLPTACFHYLRSRAGNGHADVISLKGFGGTFRRAGVWESPEVLPRQAVVSTAQLVQARRRPISLKINEALPHFDGDQRTRTLSPTSMPWAP